MTTPCQRIAGGKGSAPATCRRVRQRTAIAPP
jgi:hypothetical protein